MSSSKAKRNFRSPPIGHGSHVKIAELSSHLDCKGQSVGECEVKIRDKECLRERTGEKRLLCTEDER